MKDECLQAIRKKYQALQPYLTEKGRRIWAATEASALGRGGIVAVCKAISISNKTVHVGLNELKETPPLENTRVRKKGGGRKPITLRQPDLIPTLLDIVEPTTSGDPMRPLLWTSKSVRKIAQELEKKNFKISYHSVGSLLKDLDYSLQANKKTKEGESSIDRDAQFHYINNAVIDMHRQGQPTISVDTKKKEIIGEFKNNGQELCKKGNPIKVNGHDFPDKNLGKAVPYGVYDIGKNKGWVSVGISSDTAEFAVNSIRAWWYWMGKKEHKKATELFITADCGGSNGYRVRLWKKELQKFANETGLNIHMSHFPPGTSKWNKVEHKMFSYISKNWRGKPLISREAIVNLIGNTTTTKGLEIRAMLDLNTYRLGKKVSDEELLDLCIEGASFHPEWNYIIRPQVFLEIV
jgi:transposase